MFIVNLHNAYFFLLSLVNITDAELKKKRQSFGTETISAR